MRTIRCFYVHHVYSGQTKICEPTYGTLAKAPSTNIETILNKRRRFSGPLMIRSEIYRVTAIKVRIAVFVCFSTRAINKRNDWAHQQSIFGSPAEVNVQTWKELEHF